MFEASWLAGVAGSLAAVLAHNLSGADQNVAGNLFKNQSSSIGEGDSVYARGGAVPLLVSLGRDGGPGAPGSTQGQAEVTFVVLKAS
jgi:hypothetical protein